MNSGEFARLAGVTQRALRHWRKLGLLSDVGVSENGYFDYTVRDLVKVLRIKNLSALGFSLAQVKEMLAENGDDAQAIAALDASLAEQIAELTAQRQMLALLAQYDLPAETPLNFVRLIALLTQHGYPQILLEREIDGLLMADHLMDEEGLAVIIACYEKIIDEGLFDAYCEFGEAMYMLTEQASESEIAALAEQGTALFRSLLDDGVLAEIVMTAQGDVPDELEALFRVYDGEMFFAQQTEIVDRILENLRKES